MASAMESSRGIRTRIDQFDIGGEQSSKMGTEWRAHIVLIPFFSPSHSIPFFDFAVRLASRAVKVTILSAEYHVKKVWSDALYWNWAPRLRAAGAGAGIEVVGVRDGMYDGTWEGFRKVVGDSAAQAKLIQVFGAHLAGLMAMEHPPCCVVSDMLVGWTCTLAAQFGIPRYLLHIQPASNLSLMIHVPKLVAEGRLPLTEDNCKEPIDIPGFTMPVHPSDLVWELAHPELMKSGAYNAYLHMSTLARDAPLVLVNTFQELEETVFVALDHLRSTNQQVPRVIPIGPLLLPHAIEEEMSEENRSVMEWLEMQRPRSVLYIAFGSLVKMAPEQVTEIACALEACKQTAFLWVAGTPIIRPNEPPPPLISQLLPAGFEERTCKQGKVVTMVVPQIHILRHLSCGAFLSHCGWNSVLEGVTSGVPIIALPQQYEQRMTARYLIDTSKVAVELAEVKRGFVVKDEIQKVIQFVMHEAEGETLRSRVAMIKQLVAKYSYSNPNLDTFLHEIIQTNISI